MFLPINTHVHFKQGVLLAVCIVTLIIIRQPKLFPSPLSFHDGDQKSSSWLIEQKRRKERIKNTCENYRTIGGFNLNMTTKCDRAKHSAFLYVPNLNIMTCLQAKCGSTYVVHGAYTPFPLPVARVFRWTSDQRNPSTSKV